jgi:phosphoglycerate dehydrogenase-like enzyme
VLAVAAQFARLTLRVANGWPRAWLRWSVALVAALDGGRIPGAALDVFDEEPLPPHWPLRHHPRLQATPHIGNVTEAVYRRFFGEVVEDLLTFLDGAPVRRVG